MSEAVLTRPKEERLEFSRVSSLSFGLIGAGLLALVAAIVIGTNEEHTATFAFSWLWAFTVCFTVCGGALFWVLLHHSVDANWSVVVRRIAETVACMAPVLALLFIPLVVVDDHIWEWMNIKPGTDVLIDGKRGFLNLTFFFTRAFFYFAFFTGTSLLFRWLSTSQDKTGDINKSLWMRKFSYAGIPLFAVSISFAGIDWLMGLNPHWYSTMWGVYIFAGSAQSSLALLIVIANLLHARGYLKGVFTVEHNHIMGKLLLAFTIFWAYVAFSQYMLQYYANIPEETIFYLNRNTGTWHQLSIVLVFGHFFIPFLMLLSQPGKRDPRRLCFSACWILLFHLVDHFWIIMPQHQVNMVKEGLLTEAQMGFGIHLTDVLCIVGMPSLLIGIFLWAITRSSLFPVRDPRLYESVTLVN